MFEKLTESPNAWLEVNLRTFDQNLRALRSLLPSHTKIMAVIKANAYGHGYIEIAYRCRLNKVDYLGVANIIEAKMLRKAGVNLPILVLGIIFPEHIPLALENNIEITISSAAIVERLEKMAQANDCQIRVHLKIDTGMGRVGIRPDNLENVLSALKKSIWVKLAGVFTHFAESENSEQSYTLHQLQTFQNTLIRIKAAGFEDYLIHAANSSATLNYPQSHFDMVRLGIAMYGYPEPAWEKIQPIASLKTRIIHIKEIPAASYLGYCRTYKTSRDSIIGLLPVGYEDGLARILSNQQDVLLRGKRVPIVGNISMDQTLIDLTDIPAPQVGEEVVLIGRSGDEIITAREWAAKSGRITYEVLCGFGNRLSRVYLR